MDKETLIEMMKSEYPSSYEGIKDQIDQMDVKDISDMMEFLDMSVGDQSKKQGSGIMATEDARLIASPSGDSDTFIEEMGTASPSGDSDTFIEEKGTMAGADPLLLEEYEKYVFEMEEMGIQPMTFEEFRRAAMSGMAKAPTEEVEEIKEKKVITLAQGGIASLTGA